METSIRTEDLSKTFGSTRALVDLNLEVPQGEVLGYLGPERRRQDDDDPAAARAHPGDVRTR